MRTFEGYTARTIRGTVIDDRYVLGDLLGSGGMARVFLAHDETLNRDVALKILWQQYANNKEFVERFRREARNAAALSHPNIVSVYDWGCSEDEMYYIVMEYVPGGTLNDRIMGEGALDPGTVAKLGCQVAEALEFAHKRGVIHRDVKPQNILLTASGEAKVADFGIARTVEAATAISRTGGVLGTVGYMSPEQAMGETVGPASDLYSVGVVLYEMLTGNLPHEADSPIAMAVKHVCEPVRPPKEMNPEVTEGMNALVLTLLAKKAEDRYRSVDGLNEDLRQMCSGLLPPGIGLAGADAGAASPNSVQGTISDPLAATASKDKKWTKAPWILIAAFALFALLGGSGWSLLNDSQDRDLAPNQENSQELDSAPAPENEATKASEEAEPAPSVEVAPAKEPVQARAPSTAPPEGAGLEQTPPSNAAVEFSTFTPALVNNPVNTGPQLPLQPAAPQQAHPVQVASDEQDQVQILSSQTSYDGESEARQISGAEGGQTIKQVFESSKPSDD